MCRFSSFEHGVYSQAEAVFQRISPTAVQILAVGWSHFKTVLEFALALCENRTVEVENGGQQSNHEVCEEDGDGDSDIYTIYLRYKARRQQLEAPRQTASMFRARYAAATSSPRRPTYAMPPNRRTVPSAMRDARGAGWHRRGYRQYGHLRVNVCLGSNGCVKGRDAWENEALSKFMLIRLAANWQPRYPEGYYYDLFLKGKSMTEMLVYFDDQGYGMEKVLAKEYLDGGEMIIFKVLDSYGNNRIIISSRRRN
ncbi:hypothetical protein F5Y16DRAFT_401823 [Xylariaceae sp. FL0255]|nr:hypothetical protein F5Y16DRAFT_401823 [Xylariaceae sp. FL0255]